MKMPIFYSLSLIIITYWRMKDDLGLFLIDWCLSIFPLNKKLYSDKYVILNSRNIVVGKVKIRF
jgi:hypothetical protein